MRSLTLDVSCALNFLNTGEAVDPSVIELIRAGVAGEVDLAVTQEVFAEVSLTQNEDERRQRLMRLGVFRKLEVSASSRNEVDKLASQLLQTLFPLSTPGSTTYDHNRRDCRQLAAHKVIGRGAFVTRDGKLLRWTYVPK